MSQTYPAHRRPALVTVAAILLFLLGGVQLVVALTEFFRSTIGLLPSLEGRSNILWGGVDGLYGLVLIGAGYALLQWHAVGRTIALLIVVLLAFRWGGFVVQDTWVAIGLIAVCGIIIAALAWSDDPVVDG
jgi:hypothetical protein